MATLNDANAIFDFADRLALTSSALLHFRINNKPRLTLQQQKELEKLETDLDKSTAQARAVGIAKLGELTTAAHTEVLEATAQAEAFLKRIKKVEKAVGVATAVLGLALAITTGGSATTILQAARGVRDAAKSAPADAKG